MAFSNILRRSASSAIPMAVRVIGSQKCHYYSSSAIFTSINRCYNAPRKVYRSSSFPSPLLHYSSSRERPASDDSLLKIIESEIKCAEDSNDPDQEAVLPDGFPFELQDNPGQRTISLSREYNGETIKVEVHMPDLITTGDGDDDNDDEDNDKGSQSSLPLVVSVCNCRGTCLEFGCTAFPDEVSIDCISVKDPENSEDQIPYEGPDFSDLDENLQRAFHKYLEIRGVKASTTNFLHEYMINKDSREYMMWLKNINKFFNA